MEETKDDLLENYKTLAVAFHDMYEDALEENEKLKKENRKLKLALREKLEARWDLWS